jgi:hypothetical protein
MTVHREWDSSQLLRAREDAEQGRQDLELLRLRELERADSDLPLVIDGAHRSKLVCGDPISTTWTAWRPETGERLLLRCLHPRWRGDPVMQRQLQRDLNMGESASLYCAEPRLGGAWPHNRLHLGGPRLSELLPLDPNDQGDPLLLAQVLAGGIAALIPLHQQGLTHGPDVVSHLFFHSDGIGLAWMGRFGPTSPRSEDILHLSDTALTLSVYGMVPIRQLSEAWLHDPPLDAGDAAQLLSRAMASTLLDSRHRIWMAHRHQGRRQRIGRLATAVRQLQAALPPPAGRVCLRAQTDGQLVIAHSDGVSLRGQACTDPRADELTSVFTPSDSLSPVASRFLLRAWAMRSRGDESLRAEIQRDLHASDEEAETMMRWLSGMARLRAASLLLRAEARVRGAATERTRETPL